MAMATRAHYTGGSDSSNDRKTWSFSEPCKGLIRSSVTASWMTSSCRPLFMTDGGRLDYVSVTKTFQGSNLRSSGRFVRI